MSGFISSGFSVGAKAEYGAIKMAIIGGTVSELGGGKFANGAMGSAFQYMFNDWIDDMRQKVNENVMRNEAQHEWERKNAEALSASLRKGVVKGLSWTNTISSVATGACLYTGNEPMAATFGGISLASEYGLYLMGTQSTEVTLRHYYLDATTAILDYRYPGSGTVLDISIKAVSDY